MEEVVQAECRWNDRVFSWVAPTGRKIILRQRLQPEDINALINELRSGNLEVRHCSRNREARVNYRQDAECCQLFTMVAYPEEAVGDDKAAIKSRLEFFTRDLTPDEVDQVVEAVSCEIHDIHHSFHDVIVDELPAGLPPERPLTDHRIPLVTDAQLPKPAKFNYDPEAAKLINELVQSLLDKGHIVPSKSPIAAACFLVKQHGKHRLVMDYRGINAITADSAISMPTTEHFLAVAARAALLSKMDLKSAFHQIRVVEEDCWKTAFSCPSGVFEFKVVPFGMKGSPATTVATINLALQGLEDTTAYVDDIMIHTDCAGSSNKLADR